MDTYVWELFDGDRVLLCCDGLWEAIPEEELAESVGKGNLAQPTVQLLVETANERDGSDNISAILLRPNVSRSIGEAVSSSTQAIEKAAGGSSRRGLLEKLKG